MISCARLNPANNRCNQQERRLLEKIVNVTTNLGRTKRGLYREMRNQITTALLNLTGNGHLGPALVNLSIVRITLRTPPVLG
jgi:hypothetical protein